MRFPEPEYISVYTGSLLRIEKRTAALPLAIHCLQKAFEQIVETQNNASNNGSGNDTAEEPVLDGVI